MRTYTVKNDSGDTQKVDEDRLHEAEADGYFAVVTDGKETHRVEYKNFGAAKADGFQPISTSDVSKLESGVRSLAQGATGGWSDELLAGLKSAGPGIVDDFKRWFNGEQISPKATYDDLGRVTNMKDLGATGAGAGLYDKYKQEEQLANKEAEEANPGTYTTGKLAGSVPFYSVMSPLVGPVGAAAVQGLGESKADLTKGDVTQAAQDTAIGAGIGLIGAGIGKGISALAPSSTTVANKVIKSAKDIAQPKLLLSGDVPGMRAYKTLPGKVFSGLEKAEQATGSVADVPKNIIC